MGKSRVPAASVGNENTVGEKTQTSWISMEYYAAWGVSTSGVERGIGDYRHIFGKCKNSADIQKVNDEIECTYIPDKDEVQMCTRAAPLHSGIWHTKRQTETTEV